MKIEKTKIVGALTALMCLFMLAGPVSAANSATVTTTATIPAVSGISVDKSSLTFNLNSYDSFIAAAESPIVLSSTGNQQLLMFAKMSTTNTGISYQAQNAIELGLVDSQLSGTWFNAEGKSIRIAAKAAAGTPSGSYSNSIIFSGVAQ